MGEVEPMKTTRTDSGAFPQDWFCGWRQVVIFVVAILAMTGAGAWFCHNQYQLLRQDTERNLETIAQLKVEQIVQWRNNRLAEASLLSENPFLTEAIAKWMKSPDPEATKRLLAFFHAEHQYQPFQNVMLVDIRGQEHLDLSGNRDPLSEDEILTLASALHDQRPALSELHVGPRDLPPHLDVIAPLLMQTNGVVQAVGAICLRCNAQQFLYPLVRSWPGRSSSAETLLVRRDGDSVLYLNDLRHQPDTALKLRFPLSRTDLPAVQAVLGSKGIFYGNDYRGVPVIAVLKAIPGSPWFMVAKMDTAEAFAPWRSRSALTLILIFIFTIATVLAAKLAWQRKIKIYRYTRSLIEASLDPLLTISPAGKITDVNTSTERATGRTRMELIGTDFSDYFTEPVKARAGYQQVFREGSVRDYPLELRHSDGSVTSVLYNATLYRNELGQVVGIFAAARDITERKRADEAVRLSEERFRSLVAAASQVVWTTDPNGNVISDVPAWRAYTGQTLEEVRGAGWLEALHPEDRARTFATWQHSVETHSSYEIEYRVRRHDGQYRYFAARGVPVMNTDGSIREWVGFCANIHERKQAEQKISQLAEIVASSDDAIISKTLDGIITSWNKGAEKIYGYAEGEVIGKSISIMVPPALKDEVPQILNRIITGEHVEHYETVRRRKDGQDIQMSLTISPIRDPQGRVVAASTVGRDVTERKRIEVQKEQYHKFFMLSIDPMCIADPFGCFMRVNPAFVQLSGYSESELISRPFLEFVLPEDRQRTIDEMEMQVKVRPSLNFENRYLRKDGSVVSLSWTAYFDRKEGVTYATAHDVAERKRAEEALRQSEAQLKEAQRVANVGSWRLNLATNQVVWTEELYRMFGLDPNLPPPLYTEHQILFTPESWQRLSTALSRTCETGVPYELELEIVRGNGSKGWILARGEPLRNTQGAIVELHGIAQDITARKQAEEHLRKLSRAVEQSPSSIIIADKAGNIEYANPKFMQITGYSFEEVVGKNPRILKSGEMSAESYKQLWDTISAGREWRGEFHNRKKNGELYWESATISPILDAEGKITHFLAEKEDITEKKLLEAQFLRAQRLESIGHLAGGIAHDLNNILAPILMSIELLKEEVKSQENLSMLGILQSSARRGVDIVKQVLTFARGAEGRHVPLQPSHLLKELAKMIRETFPKNITLKIELEKSCWAVSGDATQLHQVLLNLTVNARDAMPQGGTLRLAIEDVLLDEDAARLIPGTVPGPYVMLRISDTGTGISQEIAGKIFDPFFTTKGPEKGTGLGLSTVSGIVKSHGGFIQFDSIPGCGTEFKVYLPAQTESAPSNGGKAPQSLPQGQNELILIVDDEEAVLSMAKLILESNGYRVLTASGGIEALALYSEKRAQIDLVATDLNMPYLSGLETIAKLKKLNPNVKTIVFTGADLAQEPSMAGRLAKYSCLKKPFNIALLLNTLRQILDRKYKKQ